MAVDSIGLNLSQIQYFEKKVWKQLRARSLVEQLASEGGDSVIHRVTDLKNTTWGKQAVMTLIPDDTSYGVVGDSQLEDREAGITAHDININFDQFRKAYKNVGTMDDRTYWFKFAQQVTDQLGYWAADIKDRLAINTLSGIGYQYEVDGALRGSSCEWNQNAFAADVSAPTSNRHFRWDVGTTNSLMSGTDAATTELRDTDLPTWNMFLDMRTELPMLRVKPVRGKWGNGQDLYICVVHPRVMNVLKKDTTFQTNLREAMARGDKNPIFAGADTYMVEGILLISHRYAYTTLGAASGSKWGGGTVDGARCLFLGAQALGLVEMQGPKMVTEEMDYKNRQGIACNLKFGMRKIKWPSVYESNSEQDFGVVAVDVAVPAGPTSVTI
jgi:N4-gp56 family major capsid protein